MKRDAPRSIARTTLSRRRWLQLGALAGGAAALGVARAGAQDFADAPLPPREALDDPEHRFWDTLRNEFLVEAERRHFDTAAVAIPPLACMESMQTACQDVAGTERELRDVPAATLRAVLGRFLHTDPETLAIAAGAPEAMGWLATALAPERVRRVVIAAEVPEALQRPWRAHARCAGLGVQSIRRADAHANLAEAAYGAVPEAGVLVLPAVSPVFGDTTDLRALRSRARDRGTFVVATLGAAAGIAPVDLAALDADAAVGPGHAWMLGPLGTGFLHVRPDAWEALQPPRAAAGTAGAVPPGPRRLETGPHSAPVTAGWRTSIQWIEAVGRDVLAARSRYLALRLYAGLRAIPGVEVLSAPPATDGAPLVTFRVRRRPAAQVTDWLLQELGMRLHRTDAPVSAVRASPHVVVQRRDVDWLLEAVRALV